VRLYGAHMISAVLAAGAVALHEGFPPTEVARRLATVDTEVSRMQMLQLPGDVRLIDDSYKGSLESALAAADALRALPAQRKVFVIGGIEDPPGDLRTAKRQVGQRIGGAADLLYALGSRKNLNPMDVEAKRQGMDARHIHAVGTMQTMIGRLQSDLRPGDLVLIKGRGRLRLQRIALTLAGRAVTCHVSYCRAPVPSCDVCPLLDAPPELFENHFIARYLRP